MRDALEQKLNEFLARIVPACETQCETDFEALLLRTFANEARAGLRLITSALNGGRILEVGCGAGLLSGFLAEQGFDIVGIEPGAAGYNFVQRLSEIVRKSVEASDYRILPLSAADLSRTAHGAFDLIYSFNVIEHVDDLNSTFAAMSDVLSDTGVMIHQCPNYTVPYEPHFGIPLVPIAPRATSLVVPHVKTQYPGVWDGLNFITANRAKALARKCGLKISFDRRTMGDAVRRIQDDAIYRDRQSNRIIWAVTAFARVGGLMILDAIPPAMATPMVMRLSR